MDWSFFLIATLVQIKCTINVQSNVQIMLELQTVFGLAIFLIGFYLKIDIFIESPVANLPCHHHHHHRQYHHQDHHD